LKIIVKAPEVSVGGVKVKMFPDELKEVQGGIFISIMLTV
jgi:hypothetical protein